jgi:hypothetical protein
MLELCDSPNRILFFPSSFWFVTRFSVSHHATCTGSSVADPDLADAAPDPDPLNAQTQLYLTVTELVLALASYFHPI